MTACISGMRSPDNITPCYFILYCPVTGSAAPLNAVSVFCCFSEQRPTAREVLRSASAERCSALLAAHVRHTSSLVSTPLCNALPKPAE